VTLHVPEEIEAGLPTTVAVTGSSRAGQTIHVIITNELGDRHELPIDLDANGDGSAQWTVEAWSVVNFNYSTCPEVSRVPTLQPA
jgi:hypothetical protein